jgi:hypothetical protein
VPILTLQRQMRELGRIRTGVQVDSGRGRKRPEKLDTFRLTSSSRELIEEAATVYGGDARPWDGGWEVVTAVNTLDIVVPPGQVVSQWFELWTGGGCLRRCDGVTNVLSMGPCECPADAAERVALAAKGEACKATTRLNVILPALPDLGVWRLESHGYYAAVELAGAAEVLAIAAGRGRLLPARLRLDQREKKMPGHPTNRYTVPVIEILETLSQLAPGDAAVPALEGPKVAQLAATVLPATSDLRAPAPAPAELSSEEFWRAVDDVGIPREHAIRRGGELFGEGAHLTDGDRAVLLKRLLAELEP